MVEQLALGSAVQALATTGAFLLRLGTILGAVWGVSALALRLLRDRLKPAHTVTAISYLIFLIPAVAALVMGAMTLAPPARGRMEHSPAVYALPATSFMTVGNYSSMEPGSGIIPAPEQQAAGKPSTSFVPRASALRIQLPPAALALCAVVWLLGALHGMLRLRTASVSLGKLLRACAGTLSRAWSDSLRRFPAQSPLRAATVLEAPCLGPFVAVWKGRRYLVLPSWGPERSERERLWLLSHEEAHLAHGDAARLLGASAMAAFCWPVPGLKSLLNSLWKAQEERADQGPGDAYPDRLAYARLLLDLSRMDGLRAGLAATGPLDRTHLSRRIHMLIDKPRTKAHSGRKTALLVTGALCLSLLLSAALPALGVDGGQKGSSGIAVPVSDSQQASVRCAAISMPDGLASEQSVTLDGLPLAYPLASGKGRVSMGFGNQVNPIHGTEYWHKGIDITTLREGDPVLATMDAIVVASAYDKGFGNYLVLKSGAVLVRYAHLRSSLPKLGASVRVGETVAYIGSTGLSTGPHLHYEVYVLKDDNPAFAYGGVDLPAGMFLDPLPLFEKGGTVPVTNP